MRNFFKLLVIFLFATLSSTAQHQMYKNEFGFKSDNDSFLATGQDRYYTNGLFISFRRAVEPKIKPDSNYFTKKIWSVSIGQAMYNAQSGSTTDINFVDRPFAAYLYGGFSLQYLDSDENTEKLELQIGTIGPNALGREGQEFIHSTFGFYDIKGWEFQVNNEIGVNLNADLLYLIHRSKNKKIDFSFPVKLNLGNTFTGLSTGVLLRTGSLNPLYHSVANQSNVSSFQEKGVKAQEFYFYLKPMLNIVVYDATISGGIFNNDKGPVTFNAKPLILSQELGLAYAKNRWTIDFSLIFRTKETKTMFYAHQYGSFDLYYRF